MNRTILRKFLQAGFLENGKLHPTQQGTSQGGNISPTLAVMALSGLEHKLVSTNKRQRKDKIHMITYADDFIVTAASEQLLREKVIPTLENALQTVGLSLSPEKTKITSIDQGFNFLGFNVRKYSNGKLLIKPAKANIRTFLKETKDFIKTGAALPTHVIIHQLNQKIIGWANHYRGAVSSRTFSYIDSEIFKALKRWGLKRHARKGKNWIMRKYYTHVDNSGWRFFCRVKDKNGELKPIYLKRAADTHIRRHNKIRAEANPFDPRFKEYFQHRDKVRNSKQSLIVRHMPG